MKRQVNWTDAIEFRTEYHICQIKVPIYSLLQKTQCKTETLQAFTAWLPVMILNYLYIYIYKFIFTS